MRRWKLCLALSLLASVLYVPAADAALSAEEGPGAIVSGLLADAADNPVAGNVELYAWPTGRPVEVGQTLQLLPVGYDRAARDGLFKIAGDLTPDLAELARLNGGYINFVLQAAAAGVMEETHFSRYVGDTPISAQEAGRGQRPVEWRAAPERVGRAASVQTAELVRGRYHIRRAPYPSDAGWLLGPPAGREAGRWDCHWRAPCARRHARGLLCLRKARRQ
jgi:hypothetical protein